MPINRNLHHPDGAQICAYCKEPVNLRTAKCDEDGKAVHEQCYAAKLASEDGKRPSARANLANDQ